MSQYAAEAAPLVRPAVAADLPALLALYSELHPDDPAPEGAVEVWRQISAQQGRTILVADVAGSVVGTVDCVVLPNLTRGGRSFMLVENVVVAAAARRGGVGAVLMDAAVALARAGGCYKVQLLSRKTRDSSHAFYESCGFRAVAQGFRLYL